MRLNKLVILLMIFLNNSCNQAKEGTKEEQSVRAQLGRDVDANTYVINDSEEASAALAEINDWDSLLFSTYMTDFSEGVILSGKENIVITSKIKFTNLHLNCNKKWRLNKCQNVQISNLNFRSQMNSQNDIKCSSLDIVDCNNIEFRNVNFTGGIRAFNSENSNNVRFINCVFDKQQRFIFGNHTFTNDTILDSVKFVDCEFLISKTETSSEKEDYPVHLQPKSLFNYSHIKVDPIPIDSQYVIDCIHSGQFKMKFTKTRGEPVSVFCEIGSEEVELVSYNMNDKLESLVENDIYIFTIHEAIILMEPYEEGYLHTYIVTDFVKL